MVENTYLRPIAECSVDVIFKFPCQLLALGGGLFRDEAFDLTGGRLPPETLPQGDPGDSRFP